MIKQLYIIILAILLTTFAFLAIAMMYHEPQQPAIEPVAAPIQSLPLGIQKTIKGQNQYQRIFNQYLVEEKNYNRNVSLIGIICSVIIVCLSLLFLPKIPVFNDSLLLASLFILLISIMKGFLINNTSYNFFIVCISLLLTIGAGYMRFLKNPVPESVKQK